MDLAYGSSISAASMFQILAGTLLLWDLQDYTGCVKIGIICSKVQMLQGGAEAQKRNMIKLTGAPQNLSQALLYFFATLINGREKLVHLCFAFLSLLPILAGVLSFNSSGSVTHVAGETRRVWRFHRIKNLRAIKKSGDTGHPSARAHCHKPGRGGGWGGRRHGKTQAIYFYIRFLFKEGRLWQNYVLPLWDCWFLMKHPQWGQSTWKGIKCVVCLHGDVSDLFKSINKIMTKKKNNHLLFITEGRVT